jgi:hypothetical protein
MLYAASNGFTKRNGYGVTYEPTSAKIRDSLAWRDELIVRWERLQQCGFTK